MKFNNMIIPQDFINRHGNPEMVNGFNYATCRCGTDFAATGDPQHLVISTGFKQHIAQAFKKYKTQQRQLIGGDIGG